MLMTGNANERPSVSLNFTVVVLAGVLVMLMQAGFALLVTGLCRARNAAQVISDDSDPLRLERAGLLGLRLRLAGRGGRCLPARASIRPFRPSVWADGNIAGFSSAALRRGPGCARSSFRRRRWAVLWRPDSGRRHGRTLAVWQRGSLWILWRGLPVALVRPLGLGRRLAGATGPKPRHGPRLRRFRRFFLRPPGGRGDRVDGRDRLGSASGNTAATAVRGPLPGIILSSSSSGSLLLAAGWLGLNWVVVV